MNTTYCTRGPQNRCTRRNHFLTALFVAVMVMILTVPAFAAEATGITSEPDTEVSTSTPDLVETPTDEDASLPDDENDASETVSTFEELLNAIVYANENDVIELGARIETPPELILGRADCPVTIRRATSEACLILGDFTAGNIKVQNITFDGAEIQGIFSFVSTSSPTHIFEKCSFVNCVADCGPALSITGGDTFISDCYFANNIGPLGAHLRTDGRKAVIENCTFTGGYAIYKGSVFINADEETLLIGCTVSENTAGEQGGGIYVCSALSVTGSKIYGNTVNGVADDITKDYWGRLSLMDDYATLAELYKPDGVIPNRWTVDNRSNERSEMDAYHANMFFFMTFAGNELPPPALSDSIVLDKSELTLDVGETDTLTAMLYPEGTDSNVQWTSSDPAVASVTESGFVTAHSAGTAFITATTADGGASASCRVNVQNVSNVLPTTTYFVDISANPIEGGVVNGGGQYKEGATVTVTTAPNEGFRFLSWTENNEQISTDESFTFIAEYDRTLVANFELIPKPTYAIQVNSTQGGVVDGGGSFKEGESVTVSAVPDAGYHFLRWEENGAQVSIEAQYSFVAAEDRTLKAVFALIPQSATSISYIPRGVNVQPVATSMSLQEGIKKPTLTNGKAVLTAPDDLFWSGYKTGRNNGTETVTRADLAQLAYTMMDNEGMRICGVAQVPFHDVGPGIWYEKAVGAMLDTGIMFGCGNNLFCPDHTLTWGELLTVFARFAGDKPPTEYYAGAHWAKDSVNTAFTFGWLEYTEAFDPAGVVTTGEMVNLIQAVFQWSSK